MYIKRLSNVGLQEKNTKDRMRCFDGPIDRIGIPIIQRSTSERLNKTIAVREESSVVQCFLVEGW